jgi:hypothetical protein
MQMRKKVTNRKKFLDWEELIELDPKQIIPTIKSQGRATIAERNLVTRANRWLYLQARQRYLDRVIRNFHNNIEYLKNHHNLTMELMDEVISKFSNQEKSVRFNNYSLMSGLKSQADIFDYVFAFGYAFNVSMDVLMNQNLEYLDSIACVDPFEFYLGNASDLELPKNINQTNKLKKDTMRKINRQQRTGNKE